MKSRVETQVDIEGDDTKTPKQHTTHQNLTQPLLWVGRPGGYGGVPAPDPIPNSAVKTLSADGTASQGAEE